MLTEQVRKTIEEHGLIEKKQHIVLGLSGGPDSVCLFHVLMKLRDVLDISIHPVHLNHKFRPGAAERDQEYVENLCRREGVECKVYITDCCRLAEELSMTGEEAGRKARYDAFYDTAREIADKLIRGGMTREEAEKSVRIAVAQNANDQAETVLFRILRGTGTDGLAGIAYEREERGFTVIRPLLDIYRPDIEEYCRENGLDPVTDHTNHEMLYSRNRIRLELIPFIEKGYNENIKEALVRMAGIAAQDREYIWRQTEMEFKRITISAEGENTVVMDRDAMSRLHSAVRHRLIMKGFATIGLEKDISEERIKAADFIIGKKQAPKVVEFPHGYRLKVAGGKVMFFRD